MDRKKTIISLRKFRKKVNVDFPVYKMYLFGSRVSGKIHKYSDVDIIIVSPKFKSLNFIMRGAKMYDYWNLKSPVDFLCYTPEEFNKLKKQTSIVRDAINNGIEIN